MDDRESLSHGKWECKYHVVVIPMYGRKMPYCWRRGWEKYAADWRR
jgi:hypothetical protein